MKKGFNIFIMIILVLFLFSSIQIAAEDYDFLNLKNQEGPSGVPFGGIGAGYFQIAPDGQFQRICLNNFHRSVLESDREGFFLALWQDDGKNQQTKVLQRTNNSRFGMEGFENTTYTGLFPRTDIEFYDQKSDNDLEVNLRAYSGFIPHNILDSSLPLTWVEVSLKNNNDREIDVSSALSWEDIISRGLLDVQDPDLLPEHNHQLSPVHGDAWGFMEPVETGVEKLEKEQWQGLRQYAKQEVLPEKLTFQNYNNQVGILAENPEKGEISVLPAYQKEEGTEAWSNFRKEGKFTSVSQQMELSNSDMDTGSASAVAIKTTLKPGQKKTLRFMVSWYQPDNMREKMKNNGRDEEWRMFGTADYGRYYHNQFSSFDSLLAYGIEERKRIYKETVEWQTPILESNLPDWLQFKLINSAYALYTNSVLNKAGNFTKIEGMMGGLGGTIDQRNASFPFYQKFFPELDRNEMKLYQAARDGGKINHYLLQYYVGIANYDGTNPIPGGHLIDNSMGWIIMLANDYKLHGDDQYIKQMKDDITVVYNYFKRIISGRAKFDGQFMQPSEDSLGIPEGGNTYDDFEHPAINTYNASMYLATLNAFQQLGEALGDEDLIKDARQQFEQTQQGYVDTLWNGEFFAMGSDRDGSNRRDDIMFTGQLAGQFISRLSSWGDIVDLDKVKSSFRHQATTSVKKSPENYAYKYWDVEEERGLDGAGSQAWPAYLDNYTGMLGIQAGYVQDGLEILKNTLLVHHSRGWTWSQNLWNPDFETYMTVPAAWSVNDSLAGAAYNFEKEALTLGPAAIPGEKGLTVPLYYPEFWAELDYNLQEETAELKIIKTFSEENKISKIVGQPVGTSSEERETVEIPDFEIEEGAVLDLTPYWDVFGGGNIHSPLLADEDITEEELKEAEEVDSEGDGLKAEYYDNPDFTEKIETRIDPRIDFNWEEKLPVDNISDNNFSVKWSGFYEPQFSQQHIFTVSTLGAARLWVDGELLIEIDNNEELVEGSNDLWLTAGQKYPLVLEYSGEESPGRISLSSFATSKGDTIISQSQLYSENLDQVLEEMNQETKEEKSESDQRYRGIDYDEQSGTQKENDKVAFIEDGDYIGFENVNPGEKEYNEFIVRAASDTEGGQLELRLDSPEGELVGTVEINGTSGWDQWQEFSTEIDSISGSHDIYLVFTGAEGFLFNIDWFEFK
ncbi:MAG: GH116 family glycosyl-hydrolase [bacterium]